MPIQDKEITMDSHTISDDHAWCGGEYKDWGAITFTPDSSFLLSSVGLHLRKFGNPDKLTVYIYSLTAEGTPYQPLATVGSISGIDIATKGKEYKISGEPYYLRKGMPYALVWHCEGADHHNFNNLIDRDQKDKDSRSYFSEIKPPKELARFDWWYKLYGAEQRATKWNYTSEFIYAGPNYSFTAILVEGEGELILEARTSQSLDNLPKAKFHKLSEINLFGHYVQYRIIGTDSSSVSSVTLQRG